MLLSTARRHGDIIKAQMTNNAISIFGTGWNDEGLNLYSNTFLSTITIIIITIDSDNYNDDDSDDDKKNDDTIKFCIRDYIY